MHFYCGTRKGLFRFDKTTSGWEQSEEWFLGDPVPMLLADNRDGNLYAAVEHGHFGTKLHRMENGGAEWLELDAPRYPEKPEDVPDTLCPIRQIPIPWSLEKIWSLETGGFDQPGVIWCGTIPGGLFKSTDHGETFELNRPLWDRPERAKWCGGGYDYPGIHSIAVSASDANDIVLGVSCGGAWRTLDGGDSWSQCAQGMYYDFNPDQPEDDPDGQDPHLIVRCQSAPGYMWTQHHCGIFKLYDGTNGWQRIEGIKPSSFGFTVAVHPKDPDTAWFVPAVKDEWRYPVDAKLLVNRTTDGGRSFKQLSNGLPKGKAYDLIYRHGLEVNATGDTLLMGSTTGSLWISENAGDEWTLLSQHLPPIYVLRFGQSRETT